MKRARVHKIARSSHDEWSAARTKIPDAVAAAHDLFQLFCRTTRLSKRPPLEIERWYKPFCVWLALQTVQRERRAVLLLDRRGAIEERTVVHREVQSALSHLELVSEAADPAAIYELLTTYQAHCTGESMGVQISVLKKRTGTYYTPRPLVHELLERSLGLLLREYRRGASRRRVLNSILAMTICDPACGSGSLLVEAARRLIAAASDVDGRDHSEEILSHSIYGVDIDPYAVMITRERIARLGASTAALSAALMNNIRCGNALIGAPLTSPYRTEAACDAWCSKLSPGIFDTAEAPPPLHWNIAFPQIAARGGFTLLVANPPWELMQLEEREFFRTTDHRISVAATKASRRAAIATLRQSNTALHASYTASLEQMARERLFARQCERFVRSGCSRTNLYSLFTELSGEVVGPNGVAGIIVPAGFYTDLSNAPLFRALVEEGRIHSILDFENRSSLFPDVATAGVRFGIVVIRGAGARRSSLLKAEFFRTDLLTRSRERQVTLRRSQIARLNPNTHTLPIVRNRTELTLLDRVYRRIPVFVREGEGEHNPWGVVFRQGLFNMSTDSHLFKRGARSGTLPLLEAKYIHQFDHRYAQDVNGRAVAVGDDHRGDLVLGSTRYAIDRAVVEERLSRWQYEWLLVCRSITRPTESRTLISCVVPRTAIGNSLAVLFPHAASPAQCCALLANLNSFVLDGIARMKTSGTNLNFFILKQLPVFAPEDYSAAEREFLAARVLALSFTSPALRPFAAEVLGERGVARAFQRLCGRGGGAPLRWNTEQRQQWRAELDAFFARRYGLSRSDLVFLLDPPADSGSEGFRVLRQRETQRYGYFKSACAILAAFDSGWLPR